jgi:hypothetical protein
MTLTQVPATDPTILPIRGGWAALGRGWAVFGRTEQEATDRFHDAERKHHEIMERAEPTASDPTERQPPSSQSQTAAQG